MAIPTTRRALGPHFSEGARLLWLAMESRGWTQGQLRKELDVASGRVSRWLYGDLRPSLTIAIVVAAKLGIPAETWTQAPREPFIVPAARSHAA